MNGERDPVMDFSASRTTASDLTVTIYRPSSHFDRNKILPSNVPARLFCGCNE